MQRSKEILIYLLFVVFSALLWLVLVHNQKSSVQQPNTMANQEAAVEDPVTEKRLQADISLQDVPAGKRLRLFPSHVSVCLRVRLSDYEDVDERSVNVWCSYPVREKETLPLHADVSDKRVLQVRIEPQEVQYIIEQE